MTVRVRLSNASGQPAQVRAAEMARPDVVSVEEMASGMATLLSPAAAVCFALAFWRLGQDMGWARNFFIADGPLSRWQVWFVLAGAVVVVSHWLNRRARQGQDGDPAPN